MQSRGKRENAALSEHYFGPDCNVTRTVSGNVVGELESDDLEIVGGSEFRIEISLTPMRINEMAVCCLAQILGKLIGGLIRPFGRSRDLTVFIDPRDVEEYQSGGTLDIFSGSAIEGIDMEFFDYQRIAGNEVTACTQSFQRSGIFIVQHRFFTHAEEIPHEILIFHKKTFLSLFLD
jgi:hypothetical protein